MMSLWDALRMNMMISYQELVRTFHNILWLWLLMAVVFTGIAVVFRRTPVRRGIIRKNGVVVGESVLGSSGLILARSDVSQIKRVYDEMSPGEGDKFVRTIKENTQIRMNLKK
ncbi:hypothetical protein EF945_25305 [Klebsiella pneumoniae]|nr:hypothetical protein [Klebsiella pneumoniae]NNP25646.1 hypothetical protein [Klebsiella pneumoniae]NNP48731.1 hypothetical protein [Klebsiella pneumoniae]